MIGSNVPTVGGLSKGFQWANAWGCECIQIYLTLSRRWAVAPLKPEEISAFKESFAMSSVKIVVAHVPFLVNLASPNNVLRRRSVKRLEIELSRAKSLNVPYLIIHPGSYRGTDRVRGMMLAAEALNKVIRRAKNRLTAILLETMAGQGKMLGSTFDELAMIFQKLEDPQRFGVCFDTAHVFIAGYDIRSRTGYDRIMEEFDRKVGLKKIKAFHLNDAKSDLWSGNDKHACIGEGKLGLRVFRLIVNDQRFQGIPKILEIPERDARSRDNIELLKKLRVYRKN